MKRAGTLWTDTEVDTLRRAYSEGGVDAALEELDGGRSERSIFQKARAIGATPRSAWTPAELRRARAMRAEGHSIGRIAAELGRTTKAVQLKLRQNLAACTAPEGADHAGVGKRRTVRGWTDAEDRLLEQGYAEGGPARARALLPHRSYASISMRASLRGLTRG